jgi:hypothetical protein
MRDQADLGNHVGTDHIDRVVLAVLEALNLGDIDDLVDEGIGRPRDQALARDRPAVKGCGRVAEAGEPDWMSLVDVGPLESGSRPDRAPKCAGIGVVPVGVIG